MENTCEFKHFIEAVKSLSKGNYVPDLLERARALDKCSFELDDKKLCEISDLVCAASAVNYEILTKQYPLLFKESTTPESESVIRNLRNDGHKIIETAVAKYS